MQLESLPIKPPAFLPGASQQRQIWIGRLVTFIAASCGLAWLPMIASSSNGHFDRQILTCANPHFGPFDACATIQRHISHV